MYRAFLIKYGEIAIKGKNRHLFEDALVRQITYALKPVEGKFEVIKQQGRIYVEAKDEDFDYEETVAALQQYLVLLVSVRLFVEDQGFDKLAEDIIQYLDETYPDKNMTFKVEARRARKNYPKTSPEINMDLGEKILNAFPEMSVDVHNPDLML